MLEGLDILREGLSYFGDPWNLMDAVNFGIFFLTWFQLQRSFVLGGSLRDECDSPLCAQVGYRDDWELMDTVRQAKLYLSLCVCIQLLKIIKFMKVLIPKMALATAVLYQGAMDLFFFGLVFAITMGAFSMMFYVQLGPVMEGYNDQVASFISLSRALFGDFDVAEILDNSAGYINLGLFIFYLFVAVFIMLSMFLAILGESQNAVRMEQDNQRRRGEAQPEYGIFFYAYEFVTKSYSSIKAQCKGVPRRKKVGPGGTPSADVEMEAAAEDADGNAPAVPDRTLDAPQPLPLAAGVLRLGVEEEAEAAALQRKLQADEATLEANTYANRGSPKRAAIGQPRDRGLAHLAHGGVLTPRRIEALSMRTEIGDLREELGEMAARQKKMHMQLAAMAPKSIAAQIVRHLQDGTGESVHGHRSALHIANGGGGAEGSMRQRRGSERGGEPGGNGHSTRPPAPRLPTCLADGGGHHVGGAPVASERRPTNRESVPLIVTSLAERGGWDDGHADGGGAHGANFVVHEVEGEAYESGEEARLRWQRARRALRERREDLDDGCGRATAERRREKPPTMRGVAREAGRELGRVSREIGRALSPMRAKQPIGVFHEYTNEEMPAATVPTAAAEPARERRDRSLERRAGEGRSRPPLREGSRDGERQKQPFPGAQQFL